MINRARRQFIAVIMAILMIMFLGIGIAIVLTVQTVNREKIRNMLATNDISATFDGYKRFIIVYKWDKNTYELSSNNWDLFTKEEIESIFQFIYDRENLRQYDPAMAEELAGRSFTNEYDDYAYSLTFTPFGFRLYVIDSSIPQAMMDQVILNVVVCELIGLILLFFIVYFLSYWIVKPIDDALRKQQQFISDASHELKTPLTIISANTDILQNDLGNIHWLTNIQQQTARMNTLVNEMLSLAKLQEDAPLVTADFNLSSAVTNSVLPFDCVAFEKQKLLNIDIQPNITLHGDESSVKKVVTILVDNALKYASEGGEICVRLKSENGRPILSVYNTGCELDEKDKNRVFERFYRKDTSRNSKTGGSGLGLAILKAIVDKNKWKITVQTKVGEYTKFILTF